MSGIMSEADTTIVGGGRGGLYGSNLLETALAFKFIDNNGDKGNCCPKPATCEDVWSVDKDVLSTANETQEDICHSTHEVIEAINGVGDKVSTGLYALNDKMSALAYAQQATAKDTQTMIEKGNTEIKALIKTTALEQTLACQSKEICAQNEEINRYKIIAALKHDK